MLEVLKRCLPAINSNNPRQLLNSVIQVSLLTAFVIVMFWPTWASLLGRWSNLGDVYSHAYPLLLVAFLITFWRWHLVLRVRCRPKYSLLALITLGFAMFVWLIALVGLVEIGHQLMVPIILWLVAYAALGWRGVSLFWCPLLLLLLCIPIWDYLAPLLQHLTAYASHLLLIPFGIPVNLTETTINIPSGSIVIAQACSGIGFFLSFVALGAAYCTLNKINGFGLWLVLLSSAVFGVFSNWLRVTALVLIAHYTEMQSSLVYHHTNFGWMLFFGCFFVAQTFWRYVPNNIFGPVEFDATNEMDRKGAWYSAFLLVGAFSGMYYVVSFSEARPGIAVSQAFNRANTQGWERDTNAGTGTPGWMRAFEGFSHELQLINNRWPQVSATIIRYDEQSSGRKLIGSQLDLFAGNGWRVLNRQFLEGGDSEELIIEKDKLRQLVQFHYDVAGRRTARPLLAKLELVWFKLQRRQDAGVIILSANCLVDCSSERELVQPALKSADQTYRFVFSQEGL